jgi:hypothetical protein
MLFLSTPSTIGLLPLITFIFLVFMIFYIFVPFLVRCFFLYTSYILGLAFTFLMNSIYLLKKKKKSCVRHA